MTDEPRQPGPGSMPPDPTSPPSGYGEPGYAQPGYGQPGSGQPAAGQPDSGQPNYGQQPGYGQPPTTEPAYAPPGYGQPLPGEPGVGQSGVGQSGVGPSRGSGALQGFDPQSVSPLDWGIIAAGLVAFIFSTFNFFTYKVDIPPFSQKVSVSAWHGALAPIAILLAIAAAVLLAVHLIANMQLPFPIRLVVLAAFALASLLLLLALFVTPGNTGGVGAFGIKVDKGHGIGYWVSLLAVLAGTGLSFKRFTDTGGTLPNRS